MGIESMILGGAAGYLVWSLGNAWFEQRARHRELKQQPKPVKPMPKYDWRFGVLLIALITAFLISLAAQAEPLKIIVSPHYHQPFADWGGCAVLKANDYMTQGRYCDPKPGHVPSSIGGAREMPILPRSYDGEGKLLR